MSDEASKDGSLDELRSQHRAEVERRDRAWRNHLAEMDRIAKLNDDAAAALRAASASRFAKLSGHYVAGCPKTAGWAVYDKDRKHVAGPFVRYVEAIGERDLLNGQTK